MPARPIYIFLSTMIATLFLCTCQRTNSVLKHLPTKPIDTGLFKQLNKRFDVYPQEAPDYLGGLTPNYPIATCIQLKYDDDWKALTSDTDWMTGGFIPQLRKIIVKGPNDFILINNRKELQKIYAPISTKEEALAYAILYSRGFAVFNDFYKKKKYRFAGKPEVSDVIEVGDDYVVKVFTYTTFTCHHPYSINTLRINKDGSVAELSSTESFFDPADDGVCVD